MASIARTADEQIEPAKPKDTSVAVTFPGVGVVQASATIPDDISTRTELAFQTVHPSPDSETLYKVLQQTQAGGKKFDVELLAGTRRLTIKQALLASYTVADDDATGATDAVVKWTLTFKATANPKVGVPPSTI